jgi:hypothetical protein
MLSRLLCLFIIYLFIYFRLASRFSRTTHDVNSDIFQNPLRNYRYSAFAIHNVRTVAL